MKQPPLRPPPQIFGPVWTVLYGMMGYAAHRAVTAGLNPLTSSVANVQDAKHAATLYTIQLGLNLAWMPLFFGPYRAWLGFATYLTAGVGVMNNWRITDDDLLKRKNI
jgi:benzodiazapine receptor